MTRQRFTLRRLARRIFRRSKGQEVYTCGYCTQQAVIYVNERGYVCMNCGEAQ